MSEYNTLSMEQKYAFEKVCRGNNVFITGPGGTGKSRLIKYIYNWAEERGRSIAVCAMTGCAAVLLDCEAKTIHSWSGIRLAKGTKEEVVASVLRNRTAQKTWKKTSILVLDEVSMLSARIFEILDAVGKSVRKNPLPFGGIQLVFSGDFYQLPPIAEDRGETTQFCFESPLWNVAFPPANCVELKTLFRQNDPKYIQILMEVRKGSISPENADELRKMVKRPYNKDECGGCVPTKLYPVRSKVDALNNHMFAQLSNMEYEFEFVSKHDCVVYMDGSNKPISAQDLKVGAMLDKRIIENEIKSLMTQTQIKPQLSLKKGAVVMCTANLSLDRGICNGAQGVVVDFAPDVSGKKVFEEVPVVQFSNGVRMTIPVHYHHSAEYPTIAVGQIPLCLAWALTIHKIQGATMDMAEIDVGNSVFEYGQTYVALSRIKSLKGLYLSSFRPEKIMSNPKVVAFYEAFPKLTKPQMLIYMNNHRDHSEPVLPTIEKQLEPNTKQVFLRLGENMIHTAPSSPPKSSNELDIEQYVYKEDEPRGAEGADVPPTCAPPLAPVAPAPAAPAKITIKRIKLVGSLGR